MAHRYVLLLALTLLTTIPGLAQAPTYARTPGDVLRYHLTESADITSTSTFSSVERRYEREVAVAFTFGEADTVEAVYEAFTVDSGDPGRLQTHNLIGAIDGAHRFTLEADGMGDVLVEPELTRAPLIGGALNALEFFFPHLPDEALTAGTTWTYEDSVTNDTGGVRTDTITFTVVGDSSVAGFSVAVITMAGTTLMQGPFGATGEVDLDKRDTHEGTYFFAAEEGRLVGANRVTRSVANNVVHTSMGSMNSELESVTTATVRLRES
ncbi:MAG: hypothetical protein AAF624_12170 [Bacteroidota bacterium]